MHACVRLAVRNGSRGLWGVCVISSAAHLGHEVNFPPRSEEKQPENGALLQVGLILCAGCKLTQTCVLFGFPVKSIRVVISRLLFKYNIMFSDFGNGKMQQHRAA